MRVPMGRLVFVVVLLAATRLEAQPIVLPCPTFPCAAIVDWDPSDTSKGAVDGYHLSLDGALVNTLQGAATASSPLSVPSLGTHAIALTAFHGSKDSDPPATLIVDAQLDIKAPAGPTHLRIRIAATAVGAVSQSAPFTDPLGHGWELTGGAILRDGQPAPDAGLGCTQLVLTPTGAIAAFCQDKNWYAWSETASPHWANAGAQTPKD